MPFMEDSNILGSLGIRNFTEKELAMQCQQLNSKVDYKNLNKEFAKQRKLEAKLEVGFLNTQKDELEALINNNKASIIHFKGKLENTIDDKDKILFETHILSLERENIGYSTDIKNIDKEIDKLRDEL